jgi:beta-lactam-binding protein with PASTA domain
LKDAGFQVAEQPSSINSSAKYGEVVGTSPNGQTIPGAVITIQTSNGIPPPPPPPPVGGPGVPVPVGSQVIEIPGLPPITIPILAPPPAGGPPP